MITDEAIVIAQHPPVLFPPVLNGSRELIKKLSDAENMIRNVEAEMHSKNHIKEHIKIPNECIASIVLKYGNSNLHKNVYKFIK